MFILTVENCRKKYHLNMQNEKIIICNCTYEHRIIVVVEKRKGVGNGDFP